MPRVAPRNLANALRERLKTLPQRHGGYAVLALLAVIAALGFGLRYDSAKHPVNDPGRDATAYQAIAAGLFETGRYGTPEMHHPTDWSPGAPLFFAAVYYVSGNAYPERARVAVAFLGLAMILIVYLIGRRLAGPAAGLLAAALAAIYPTFIENNGQMLTEPVAAFLLSAAVLAFMWASDSGRRIWAWAVPGLFIGATALTRPEYVLFGGVFAILALVRVMRQRRAAGRAIKPALLGGVAAAAVLVVAFVVPLAPWTVRNYVVVGHFVPLTTGGGKALFVATYLPGDGRQVPTKRDLISKYPDIRLKEFRADKTVTLPELKKTEMVGLLNRVAQKYPNLERDAALAKIGRENFKKYLTEQPVSYLKMTASKIWNIWRRGSSPAMRDTGWLFFHRLILLFGLVGLGVLIWRRRFDAWLFGSLLVIITLLGGLLLGVPRRNVPLMPLVIALAGAGFVWMVEAIARSWSGGRPDKEAAAETRERT